MTADQNKARLKQLGWGEKKPLKEDRLRQVYRAEKQIPILEIRILKLEKELLDIKSWLVRLSIAYKTKGYDARLIDAQIDNIKRALW